MSVKTLSVLGIAILTAGLTSASASPALETAQQAVVAAKIAYETQPNNANRARYQQATQALLKLRGPANINPIKATVSESEPNNTTATATELVDGDRGTADISPAADRDFWTVTGVNAGDVVFVAVDSEVSGTGADTEMSVFENDGTTLIEFDDDSGDGLGSGVVATIPTAGSIFFEVNEFGDNGTIEPYNIVQFVTAPTAGATEVEPNDTVATASPIGVLTTGDIAGSDDFFQFSATAGDRIVIVADNDPNANANLSDIGLTLLDTDGTTVLASEAPFTVTGQNVAAGTAANTGIHFLQVADGGSGDGDTDYRFAIILNDGALPVELQSFEIE